MLFEVRALTAQNIIESHIVEALDEVGVRSLAEQQQWRILRVTPKTKGFSGLKLSRRPRSQFSLTLFSQELLALLEAGLSLVEGLEALLEKESSSANRVILDRLLSTLREGSRLSSALAAQSETFPPLYVGIVQAAERTSDLPRALARFIDYQVRLDAVRSRIISALIYPTILMVVGGAVSLFLLGYVVPRFSAVYQGSGRELPWLSQMLLEWGTAVSNHVGLVLFGVVGMLIALTLGIRHLLRSGRWLDLVMKIPGIGERARIMELSRLYLTLGMLLEGGIAMVQALGMVSGALGHRTQEAVALAKTQIAHGDSVSQAFDRHGLATPIALRMLRVGERSGQLGTMLTKSALFYEGETARWIERFTRAFEPILMAAIGLIVGLIVVLLYMPIFELAGSLQ